MAHLLLHSMMAGTAPDHPNLIHVYEYEEEYGMLYVIMELLEGGDLFDKVRKPLHHAKALFRVC